MPETTPSGERLAPIQQTGRSGYSDWLPAARVPWAVTEYAHRDYGAAQSLEGINSRGGFGWVELAVHIACTYLRENQGDPMASWARSRIQRALDGR